VADPTQPVAEPPRGSVAPGLIILAITVLVMIGGILVVRFPEQMGVPGLDASPASVVATPTPGT
jgi:hypothetical protein